MPATSRGEAVLAAGGYTRRPVALGSASAAVSPLSEKAKNIKQMESQLRLTMAANALLEKRLTEESEQEPVSEYVLSERPSPKGSPRNLSPKRAEALWRGLAQEINANSPQWQEAKKANARVDIAAERTRLVRSGAVLWRNLAIEVKSNSAVWHALQMEEWKVSQGIPLESRVFAAHGQACQILRQALVDRGDWFCNNSEASLLWDIKFSMWNSFKQFKVLAKHQAVSHFERTDALTTKVGLSNSLLTCLFPHEVQIDSFYPRCYDLSKDVQVEAFQEDFKVTKCLCLLRRFVRAGGRSADRAEMDSFGKQRQRHYPRAVISAALAVCKRRLLRFRVDDKLDDRLAPLITSREWASVRPWSLERPGRCLKLPRGARAKAAASAPPAFGSIKPRAASAPSSPRQGRGRIQRSYGIETQSEPEDNSLNSESESIDGDMPGPNSSECNEADLRLMAAATEVLEELSRQSPQFAIDGAENIWVLKPARANRGRGIQVLADLENIMKYSRRGFGGIPHQFVVQKYIENPLIINKKKWDIRQWVLVTCWEPLSAWFYQDCYVRFSFDDYDSRELENKFAHLTNNCISKQAKGYAACKDETMWHSDELREHLSAARLPAKAVGDTFLEDPWIDYVQPQLKACVMRSLEAASDGIISQKNSFELFGYDFMVSDDLNVWLIEVNSVPDLSASTSVTKHLVNAMLEDLLKVVIDVEGFGAPAQKGQTSRPRRIWDQDETTHSPTGRWELLEPARIQAEESIRKHSHPLPSASLALNLRIKGKKLHLRKPYPGECPRGTDADVLPQYCALHHLRQFEEKEIAETKATMEAEAVQRAAAEPERIESEAAVELKMRASTVTLTKRIGSTVDAADAESDGSADSSEVHVAVAAPSQKRTTIAQRASRITNALKSLVRNRLSSRPSIFRR